MVRVHDEASCRGMAKVEVGPTGAKEAGKNATLGSVCTGYWGSTVSYCPIGMRRGSDFTAVGCRERRIHLSQIPLCAPRLLG
jgi:hypothetical protein